MGWCTKKVMSKISEVPQDAESIEAYKRIWIDILKMTLHRCLTIKIFQKIITN